MWVYDCNTYMYKHFLKKESSIIVICKDSIWTTSSDFFTDYISTAAPFALFHNTILPLTSSAIRTLKVKGAACAICRKILFETEPRIVNWRPLMMNNLTVTSSFVAICLTLLD